MTRDPTSARAFRVAAMALLVTPLGALPAHADRVWLKNGNYLEGEARELPDGQVAIVSAAGTLTISRASVERIERSQTLEQRVAAFLEHNPGASADALYDLARDCREAGGETLARRVLERALRADPEHEASRRALGFQRYDDRWVTEEELRELRGEVWYRGQWMSAEKRAELLYLEAQRDIARAERLAEHARAAALEQERRQQAEEARLRTGGYGIPLEYLYPPVFGAPIFPPGIVVPQPFPKAPAKRPDLAPEKPRPAPPPAQPPPGRQYRNRLQRIAN